MYGMRAVEAERCLIGKCRLPCQQTGQRPMLSPMQHTYMLLIWFSSSILGKNIHGAFTICTSEVFSHLGGGTFLLQRRQQGRSKWLDGCTKQGSLTPETRVLPSIPCGVYFKLLKHLQVKKMLSVVRSIFTSTPKHPWLFYHQTFEHNFKMFWYDMFWLVGIYV